MPDEERIEQLELEVKVLRANNKGLKDKIDEQSKEIEECKKQLDLDNECEIALNSKVMDLEKEIEELNEENNTTIVLEANRRSYDRVYNLGKIYTNKKWKDKIKAKIEEAKKSYNDLHTKHLRDCGIAEQRELAKIEFGQSLLEKE